MITSFIELTSNTTFKYLYKNDEFRPWLNEIIKNKFNIDLKDFILVDNEENTGNKIKDYRLDIKLKKDNEIVIIEMNDSYYEFLENKNYQYLYRVAGSLYDQGENYSNKKVKLILFNNYKNKLLPELKTGNYKFSDIENNLVIEDIESYEIYLPNFKDICYHIANTEDVSLSIMTCSSYEEMKKKTNNPNDLRIIKELERLGMDQEFKNLYDEERVFKKTQNSIRLDGYHAGLDEGIEQGISQGIEQGISQGIEQRNKEIAKSLLDSGMNIEDVSKHTNLSKEEINELK